MDRLRCTCTFFGKHFVLFVLAAVIFFPVTANAVDTQLAWGRSFGSDIAGYRLYYRQAHQSHDYNHPLWEGTETETAIAGLQPDTNYYFVVRAFNTSNIESADSNEVLFYKEETNTSTPVADAGPDQTVNDQGLVDSVTLNGANSYDPDSQTISYLWSQLDGPAVTLSDPNSIKPVFSMPEVDDDGVSLTFQLFVIDEGWLHSTDSVIINVTHENKPPVSDSGHDQTVNDNIVVVLDGSGSYDTDDAIVSFLWSQTSGAPVSLSDPAAEQPYFTAPVVLADDASLSFQLTVTDSRGLKSTDSCIVDVKNPTSDSTGISSDQPVMGGNFNMSEGISSGGGCFISTSSSDRQLISFIIKAAGNFMNHFFNTEKVNTKTSGSLDKQQNPNR